MPSVKKIAKNTRLYRVIHGTIAPFTFAFFMLIAATGLLLGWKKNTGGYLQAPTQKGVSSDLETWLPWDSLQNIAFQTLHDSIAPELSTDLDRIDARPDKGIVKFVFADHYWGIQLDGTTGQVLMIEKRRSDFIEHLHDGSLFDKWLGGGDFVKLTYTTAVGLSLLVLAFSGFFLWWNPKRIRRAKHAD